MRRAAVARRQASALRRHRRRVAAGVSVALVLVILGIFTRELPGTEHWTITAVFQDTTQIRPGSPVRMAGVDVGKVLEVRRGPGTSAELTLEVGESGRPLHDDARAAIRPRLFLEGSYYVDLQPGSPSAPDLGRGDTIPLGRTTTPVQFSSVISTLTKPVRTDLTQIIGESAEAVDEGGARGFKRSLKALGPSFEFSAVTLEAARGTDPDDLPQLIRGAQRVTAALTADAPALASGITDFARVASALADADRELVRTVDQLRVTLRDAPAPLREIRASLPAVRSFATAARPAVRQAPATLTRTLALLRQLRGLAEAGELPRLSRLLPPANRQLTALNPKLRELLPRVGRVSDCTSTKVMDLLNAKLDDGALSTGQPIWQEIAHVSAAATGTTGAFDANLNWVKGTTDISGDAISLGAIPGAGVIASDADTPILGARPQWNGPTLPPFRPDVPCATQPAEQFQSPVASSGITMTKTVRVSRRPSWAQTVRATRKLAQALKRRGGAR